MKKVLLTFVLALASVGVFAQNVTENTDKYKVETNRFWNNWFFSVGGGVDMYRNQHGTNGDMFKNRLNPTIDVALGKWFTPSLGLRLAYSGLERKSVDANLNRRESKYMHLHNDILFNVSEAFWGHSNRRGYSFIPYAGFGWLRNFNGHAGNTDVFGFNVGLLNEFRLSPALSLNLDIRATTMHDRFDGEPRTNAKKLRSQDQLYSATLGLTYKFKKRGWDRATVISTGISEDEMRRIQNQLRDAQAYNNQLKEELEAARNRKPEVVVKKEVDVAPRVIFFPIGKSTLTKQDRVNIGYMAQAIKASDKVYTITGYADKATGSASWNQRLSQKRAEAVRDVLVNEFGVKESQVKIDAKGGVDNMFYDQRSLSRVVIME